MWLKLTDLWLLNANYNHYDPLGAGGAATSIQDVEYNLPLGDLGHTKEIKHLVNPLTVIRHLAN